MYINEPMRKYLDELASNSPTPGGGSVSALVGALGAALVSMVANFTVGKEKYREVEQEVRELLEEAENLRKELSHLTEEDTQAYGKVSQAYSLPKGTEEEKVRRASAIQEALKEATQVPLHASTCSYQVLKLTSRIVDKGNVNLLSDVGVATVLAEAALQGAALNVEVNLASIKDEAFIQRTREIIKPYLREAPQIRREVWEKVVRKITGS